jgi:3-oxoacyl-[acyl-carrier protein] reductase
MKEINLIGKTALVTGATRGIGFFIARELLSAGASLILTGTKKESKASLIKELTSYESNQVIEYMDVDFTDMVSTNNFIDNIKSKSKIDICVNNAGINEIKNISDITIEDIQYVHSVNLYAPFLILKTVLDIMKKNDWGRVVNIGSLWSILSRRGRSTYASSKYALMGLTVTAALEYASHNVLVNMVSPGFVWTDLSKSTLSAKEKKAIEKNIPVGKFANPEDIANTVLFLCSNLNNYITGQNIIVDGGYICE